MGYNYHRAFYQEISRVYAPCSGKALFLAATLLLTSAALGQEGATLTIDLTQAKAKVSPQLYGLMTEEINYPTV
jgi:hypothetical protein